jgi:hypothetical protein
MPTWLIKWRESGETEVIADRLTAAQDKIGADHGDEEFEITGSELVDGEVPDLTASLKFLGKEFPIVYKQGADDESEMPLFWQMAEPGWWTNGHVALHLDEDPPVWLREPEKNRPSVYRVIEAQPRSTFHHPKVAPRYRRFLVDGDYIYRGESFVCMIEIQRDGKPVALIMCERSGG